MSSKVLITEVWLYNLDTLLAPLCWDVNCNSIERDRPYKYGMRESGDLIKPVLSRDAFLQVHVNLIIAKHNKFLRP